MSHVSHISTDALPSAAASAAAILYLQVRMDVYRCVCRVYFSLFHVSISAVPCISEEIGRVSHGLPCETRPIVRHYNKWAGVNACRRANESCLTQALPSAAAVMYE